MVQARDRVLPGAFALYLASSLLSQATMSIGAGILGAALLERAWRRSGPAGALSPASWARGIRAGGPEARLVAGAALALAVALVASMAWAKLSPVVILPGEPLPTSWDALGKLWYLPWPICLAWGWATQLDEADRRRALRVWGGTLVFVLLVGLVQFLTAWPRGLEIPAVPGRYHLAGFLGHHLSAASILIFPFFAALSRVGEDRPARRLWAPAVVLGVLALPLTFSRTLWVALPLGLGLWSLRFFTRRQALTLTLGFVALGGGAFLGLQSVRDRLLEHGTKSDRYYLLEAHLGLFERRPLLGVGPKNGIAAAEQELRARYGSDVPTGGFVSHAHNNLVDQLATTGLLGTAAWALWLVALVLPAWRSRRGEALAWALVCAWTVFHLNGLTQVNAWEGKVMHQMAIAGALALAMRWRRPA